MTTSIIKGQIIGAETRQPLAGVRVEAWDKDLLIDDLLGSTVTDAAGGFAMEIDRRYYQEIIFDRRPDVYFKVYREERLIANTAGQVLWNVGRAVPEIVIVVSGASPTGDGSRGKLEVRGRVTDDRGVAARGVPVEALDHHLGGTTSLGSTTTDDAGVYSIRYTPAGKPRADLEVRALGVGSKVIYDARSLEQVNLVIPTAQVLRATEYERLMSALQRHLAGAALGELAATAVSYLANKTGWDPRSVAMAAQAARLAGSTHIPAAHYYALFRAGAPSDGAALSRLSTSFIEQALASAIDTRIIPATGSIEATVAAHKQQSAGYLELMRPAGAVSSLGEMLDLRLDATAKSRFIAQYQAHGDAPSALWQALADDGFAPETIAALQTDGKLGYLTGHNAPLVVRLREQTKITDATDLAHAGLYRTSAWTDVIGDDVPAGLTRDAYAAGLAAQVNLSYPTLVTAEMLRRDEVAASAANEVAAFLTAGHPAHRIGVHPVKTWHGYGELSPEARLGARQVERMYQISPSNESMMALSRHGLHSAYQVVADPPEVFLARHGDAFPSEEEARAVYAKAQAVHSTTLSLATAYLAQRATPNVYGATGALEKLPFQPQEDVPGVPSLEALFDNLDYCACDACKSVLSPAAYLVELLQFIDLPPAARQGGQNPIEALRARRPDLEHLLLSCENTHIVLPYVDLVNEVLEFYVVSPSFTAFRQHDLGADAVSADLLADPQLVEDGAYVATKNEVYPWTFPFDMPLAAMRLILETCGTTLSQALHLLGDAAGARRERLGLNAGEQSILTSAAYRALPVYFGLPASTTLDALNAQIAEGKTFSRLTGVTYEELVAVLKTRFINPGIALVPALERLAVPLGSLAAWYTGTLSDTALRALLPEGLEEAEYGGDILDWLKRNRDLILGLITLTDTSDPAAPDECNFAALELRFASPDMATNRLTALAYHKLLRFIRLWKKLGWSIELTDLVVTALLPTPSQNLTDATIDAAFQSLLARIANFLVLLDGLSVPAGQIPSWLGVWDGAAAAGVRRERLAGVLRIGVTDLDDLSAITGLDPLAADLESSAPSLLRLVTRWRELKAIGLKVTDLSYLLRHADTAGKLAPGDASLLRGLRSLRDGLTAVDGELTMTPGNADLAFAKTKMALVYDGAVVNRFFALAGDTSSYSAPMLVAEELLPDKLTAVDARLSYDPFARRLGFTGILPAGIQAALTAAADSLIPADVQTDLAGFVAAFKAAVQALADAGAQDLSALDAEYPELEDAYLLMKAAATPADGTQALLDAILSTLRKQLKRLSLRGALAASLQADPQMVDALTSGPAVVHAHGNAGRDVLTDFERLETAALWNADGVFRFYLDPPTTDDYILYVAVPPGTTVALALGGTTAIPATAVGASGEVQTGVVVELSAGTLVLAELTLAALPADHRATLRWRSKGMGKTEVPAARIYDQASTLAARASLIRLQKAATLARLLALTPREVAYFAGDHEGTLGVLNALDIDGSINPPDLRVQWDRVAPMIWFAALKQETEPEEDTWVTLLEDSGLKNAQGELVILGVNGWKGADLTAVLSRLGLVQGDLAQLSHLRTVKGVLEWVAAADYPAADLLAWCSAAPTVADLAAAKATIRARLQDAPWRETMKSVNDALRNQRRDALVNYILHHKRPSSAIDTADKLYEHFLIDVQMDACMQTSRIRQALSTVQLFITRCFMNLEPGVSPAALRADRWEYMKRYRVWEANRKIFLYPENWLEPELRDNKSPFFRELEAELLKADITDELAEHAFLSYLQKLDHVARLEIAGATVEQRTAGDPDDDVLHVFGRTIGATREHYYRRYEGGYWLPWDKVALNIQGDHLLPVIWKGRLFVFWLDIVEKAEPVGDKSPEEMRTEKWHRHARKTAEITLAWGEYYQGKWSSPKSTHTAPPLRITGLTSFEPGRLVLATRTVKPADSSERLIINVTYWHDDQSRSFKVVFTSKHAPPIVGEPGVGELLSGVEGFNYFLFWQAQLDGELDHDTLRVPGNTLKVNISQPEHASSERIVETLLTKTGSLFPGFRIRPTLTATENRWEAPFFYYDEHSTFFVQPDEAIAMVDQYNHYYFDLPPAKVVELPPIYEVPIRDFDPAGPVINPPLDGLARGINPVAQFVLPNNTQFEYDGAKFDARGVVQEAR